MYKCLSSLDIPIYSALYAASEGLIGFNMWPEEETCKYLLLPEACFFEFIPVEISHQEQPATLLLHQVTYM